MDEIVIRGLRVSCRIGVPDEERAEEQEIELDVTIEPVIPFEMMNDDVAQTVDYALVCDRLKALAAAKPRHLIETLASDLASLIITEFPCRRVTIDVRKFILPDTDWVGVRHSRRVMEDSLYQTGGHER
ncbi:MAG: hypothetical protein Fur0032_07520 [Terrimicrobiaceae bacterium]